MSDSADGLQIETDEIADEAEAPHAYRVTIRGEIDLVSAPALLNALEQLAARGAKLVVVDASDVAFVDSTGVRALLAAGDRLTDSGGQLLIEGMSGAVQQVLEITGLIEHYRGAD